MKPDPIGVATDSYYMDGDHACAEGAIAAGCRFFAGYPITPSTEVAERIAERFPKVGGLFIQMEDELASMAAVVGAAWAGTKAMTVTSGPGFSLMMENLGLAAMMETPCVVVNVQRCGASLFKLILSFSGPNAWRVKSTPSGPAKVTVRPSIRASSAKTL